MYSKTPMYLDSMSFCLLTLASIIHRLECLRNVRIVGEPFKNVQTVDLGWRREPFS